MEADEKYNPLPRAIALILVALCIAWFIHRVGDPYARGKIDSMSQTDYIEYQRHVHGHSYLFIFFVLLVEIGFCLGVVEIVAYLIRALIRKRRDH
jgi:hypothetical protein